MINVKPESSISHVIALLNARRYAELESQARLWIEGYPDSGFAWKILGICLQAQGKDVLHAFQMTARLLPEDAEAHNNLGVILKDLGQLDAAVTSCRQALAINPNFAHAYSNLSTSIDSQSRQIDT